MSRQRALPPILTPGFIGREAVTVKVGLWLLQTTLVHEVATRSIGGPCQRPPSATWAAHWRSRRRFHDVVQANARALTLADFLGVEVR